MADKQISAKRQRKIDHLKSRMGRKDWTKAQVRQLGLHHMRMPVEDVQAAMGKMY